MTAIRRVLHFWLNLIWYIQAGDIAYKGTRATYSEEMQARNTADKERMVKRQRWVYCSVFGCFNGGRRTASWWIRMLHWLLLCCVTVSMLPGIRVPCRLQRADCYFRYVGCRRFVMVVDDAGLSDDALSWIIQWCGPAGPRSDAEVVKEAMNEACCRKDREWMECSRRV